MFPDVLCTLADHTKPADVKLGINQLSWNPDSGPLPYPFPSGGGWGEQLGYKDPEGSKYIYHSPNQWVDSSNEC